MGVFEPSRKSTILRDSSGVLDALAAKIGRRLKTADCARAISFSNLLSLEKLARSSPILPSAAPSRLTVVDHSLALAAEPIEA